MPVYEYICDHCNKPVELLIRNQAEVPHCPDCGSDALQKQISSPAAVFARPGGLMSCGQKACAEAMPSCAGSGGCCGHSHS